jgi:hypothetical protein
MILIVLIILTVFIFLNGIGVRESYEKHYSDKEMPYYEEIDELDIPLPEKDCKQYAKFEEINKKFYTSPKFLYPQDACMSQCIQGIWFNHNHTNGKNNTRKSGYMPCCQDVCFSVKN